MAELQKRLSKVKSVRFTVVERSTGFPDSKYTLRVLEPDHVRVEHSGKVSISDLTRRSMIQLDHQKRHAVITIELAPKVAQTVLHEIRTMPIWSVASLPTQPIDGRQAISFLIDHGTKSRRQVTLWVKAETKLPVRLESVTTVPRAPDDDPVAIRLLTSEFAFDESLVPALFSMDVPAG